MSKTKIITAAEMADHYRPLGELYAAFKRIEKLEADNARLREALESAIDTLRDAEVCDDTCVHCNDARAALAKRGLEVRAIEG